MYLLGAVVSVLASAASLAELSEGMLASNSALAIDVIVGIDRDTRAITHRDEETGREFVFIAGPEVRNFDQLQRGDLVFTEYYEAFGLAIAPAGSGLEGRVDEVDIERAAQGAKPGVRITEATYVTGVLSSVDRSNRLVTLEGPERSLVVRADADIDLTDLEEGQSVEALYLESLAIVVEPAPEVSGTLSMSLTSVALGVGIEWGRGLLTLWDGEEVEFKIRGLTLLDAGVASVTATGDVYGLVEPEDLEGTYASAEAGATLVGGGSTLTMRNNEGVIIRLSTEQSGARLTFAGEGLRIRLN
jgi:hypothetical protein